ncbi:hypothetical protein F511_21846 [Dorcoceras hygrometricum]|uniref:Uncharacterized protein n=1 Tax=Dorcoceras hygrometricum TaxID=472368 RepID=A0A2Z7A3N0_9LAMI|nr:hypothetical protein F511_21846 [Dorcoceras hygrometricum]
MGEQHSSPRSCALCSPRQRSWLVPLEPAGPGGGPVGGTPARGGRSKANEALKVAGRMRRQRRLARWARVLSWAGRFDWTDWLEHAEPLSSLGLNAAGDDPVDEYIPTGGEDLCAVRPRALNRQHMRKLSKSG